MSQAKTATDHEETKHWIEGRQGRPAVVKGTEGGDGDNLLRVDFREPDDKLEEISWGEFFQTFEGRELAFLHQKQTKDGKPSRFFKFVNREG